MTDRLADVVASPAWLVACAYCGCTYEQTGLGICGGAPSCCGHCGSGAITVRDLRAKTQDPQTGASERGQS